MTGDELMVERSRAYLEHVRALRYDEMRARDAADEMRQRATGLRGIGYTDVKVTGGDTLDMASIIADLQDAIAVYCERASACWGEQMDAIHRIEQIPDRAHAAVLVKHYINGRTWYETANEVGYSESHIYRIADIALAELYEYLPPEWKLPHAET